MKKTFYLLLAIIAFYGCQSGSANTELNLSEILASYIESYKNTISVDTTYRSGNDTVRVQFSYRCLMDSSIVVPRRYVEMYGMDKFVTHNFASSIIIQKNRKTVVDRKIVKSDFNAVLEEHLKEYGTLLYPYIYYYADSVRVNYSLSFPLTDVGIGVSAVIRKDSSVSFSDR